jgi:hypothetical protein
MSDHRRADARILQNVLVEELVGNKDKLESLFRDVSTAEFGRFQSSRVLRVPNQQDMRLDDVMLSLWTLDLPFALLVRSN